MTSELDSLREEHEIADINERPADRGDSVNDAEPSEVLSRYEADSATEIGVEPNVEVDGPPADTETDWEPATVPDEIPVDPMLSVETVGS